MKRNVPRPYAGGTMTEAQYWAMLKNALRRLSMLWPPISKQVWLKSRRPNQSSNARLRYEYQCACCGFWFPQKLLQVDHIVECGPIRDIATYVSRMFCEVDGLQLLCKACHQAKTNKARRGDAA